MTKQRRISVFSTVVALLLLLATIVGVCVSAFGGNDQIAEGFRLIEGLKHDPSKFYDGTTVQRLPSTIDDDDLISVIVKMDSDALLDAYQAMDTDMSFTEFAFSDKAAELTELMALEKAELKAAFDKSGVEYKLGADYATVFSGFEMIITARDFLTVTQTVGNGATVIVGEQYEPAETKLVENKVNVYDTGIFNSSDFPYKGEGTVVAVLDTGTDHTHTAFSTANFTSKKLGLTKEKLAGLLANTRASVLHSGLKVEDVYYNDKLPFNFDYADFDPDVTPYLNHHGTHVAGVIAGKDDVITGVAPNAQIVTMKIFSDLEASARTSWILAALEDCVVLGVDVINMSIGTSCGFSREMDREAVGGVYDKIREAGIAMVVAASNSYTSTYGSEKNGNLGLTSNPDTATVGSPSTYKGALSVASIQGVKTPYMLFDNEGKETIVYFDESTDRFSEEKNFFEELLKNGETEKTFEYVTIPGVGRSADYTGLEVEGKIVLVARGSTTFEEKAMVAIEKKAAGIIVYNNVAGEIKMNMGEAEIPAISISQDNGEMMAAKASGTVTIAKTQTSGPFMSDFSSWGPTPDLGIKPEITAHGGSILSAMPGQTYDRLSGTSMACPNVSGVSLLMQQYVKGNEAFASIKNNKGEVTAMVNRLLMSTADIVRNTNDLPYAVRKQGAGLANLKSASETTAYILTYDRYDGSVMNTSKIELGDDPEKKGVYSLTFSVVNFGKTDLSYEVGAWVMSEGVSETKTNRGETTVNELGYLLNGAKVEITSIENATQKGMNITVAAGKTAKLTVTITLSDEDKKYLDDSFENGYYVEGFVTLDATAGTEIDLSVPYLAFYGDWTKAPLFDLDYFATNKDELDDAIDLLDKTLPDAYATRPIGGLSEDYVSYLGAFYFQQDPTKPKISADRKYISLSNQTDSVNSLRAVWAGMLRGAKSIDVSITDDATGEVIFHTVAKDVRKSYGDGGSIYPANVEIFFSAIDHNLKNNSTYTVKLEGLLDYGDGGKDTNLNNTFEFPLVADFEAPAATDCEFYTEYDRSEKKTRYFAKISVYDNHYAMAGQLGYVTEGTEQYEFKVFDTYVTSIQSKFNSTTEVVYELTDHMNEIIAGTRRDSVPSIAIALYDYALNQATYEIPLPADFVDLRFDVEGELLLSPNELYTLDPLVYPETEWSELLEYTSSNNRAVKIVGNKLVAVAPGVSTIRARDPETGKTATMRVRVRAEGDEGYKRYDKPVADAFVLTGYKVNKAYYYLNSEDRDIGVTGDEIRTDNGGFSLSMFPSESVSVLYSLIAYFPEDTEVVFRSSNSNIAEVTDKGVIVAKSEGFASISVRVLMDGKSTLYSATIPVEVKEPWITSGPNLTHYFGNGGLVTFPKYLAITAIGEFAFANFDYIPKTEDDEISDETPETTKPWYLGDATIEEVIIPEGVKTIGSYAFAGLTKLKKITLPSTIESIDKGAFLGCSSLETVVGLEHVKFINQAAFEGCALKGDIKLTSAVAVANRAFANNQGITSVTLSEKTQTLAAYAFARNTSLTKVTIPGEDIQLGKFVFQQCFALEEITVNATVIPYGAFYECSKLKTVNLGKDVALIAEYAFGKTRVTTFTVDAKNAYMMAIDNGRALVNKTGDTLLLVGAGVSGAYTLNDANVTTIGTGAFSGNTLLTSVTIPSVTVVGDYAFADCSVLSSVSLGKVTGIGNSAFMDTAITEIPLPNNDLSVLDHLGPYAFAGSKITSVTVPAGFSLPEGAFYECMSLKTVVIGDGAVIGTGAFSIDSQNHWKYDTYKENGVDIYYYIYESPLRSLTIGKNVTIGERAFYGACSLETVTLGEGATIGDYAFYNAASLKSIDLSRVTRIGDGAFSGDILFDFISSSFTTPAIGADGNYIYRYFTPDFTSLDLSSLTELGEQAFSYCRALTSVTLGAGLTEIEAGAFQACVALEQINLDKIVSLGENAFAEAALTSADLSSAEKIGKYAFVYNEELTSITLNESGTRIEEGAFSYCKALTDVENMASTAFVGDYSFAYTALTAVDLSAATYIGTQAFLKESATPFAVKLGAGLTSLGDNPFAFCLVAPFTRTVTESFNGVDYTREETTFDISATVRVIDGSLYQTVPYGLELVTFATDADRVTVADGTVRITAMAFAGNDLVTVSLPYTVASIGHKAFFGCEKLMLVSFASYDAPVLEEEYDVSLFNGGLYIPATGDYELITPDGSDSYLQPGLGVIPYFMWNVSSLPTNIYYGASFVDHIGCVESPLLMVRPSNGQNYDSFIFAQYFSDVLDGATAADDTTLAAIAAISKLPDNITLEHKALVEAARAAYTKIASEQQRSLVSNYAKLTQAEKRISDLEFLANGGEGNDNTPIEPDRERMPAVQIVLIVLSSVFFAAAVAEGVLLTILYIKKKRA